MQGLWNTKITIGCITNLGQKVCEASNHLIKILRELILIPKTIKRTKMWYSWTLTGILASSLSSPSVPVILTLNLRGEMSEGGCFDPSASKLQYKSDIVTSTILPWRPWPFYSQSFQPYVILLLTGKEPYFCIK